MTDRTTGTSPRTYARLAGLFYLLEGATALFGQFYVRGRLLVRGDAAATAANILGRETLFRLGFASALLAVALHVVWALLFYELLKPAHREVSFLAAFVLLVGCAIQAAACLFYAAPWFVLTGGSAASAFTAGQRSELALLFLELNGQTFNIYLVFFGLWCGLVGYLIFRSTFLPRWIGPLMGLAGLGFATLAWAPLARYLAPFNSALAAPGELSLMLWLLVKGVDVPRWREQAGVGREQARG